MSDEIKKEETQANAAVEGGDDLSEERLQGLSGGDKSSPVLFVHNSTGTPREIGEDLTIDPTSGRSREAEHGRSDSKTRI